MRLADSLGGRILGKRTAPSTPKIDHEVTDVDVFEHAMKGVQLAALLGVLATFAKNSAALTSHGSSLFRIAVEAIAITR